MKDVDTTCAEQRQFHALTHLPSNGGGWRGAAMANLRAAGSQGTTRRAVRRYHGRLAWEGTYSTESGREHIEHRKTQRQRQRQRQSKRGKRHREQEQAREEEGQSSSMAKKNITDRQGS